MRNQSHGSRAGKETLVAIEYHIINQLVLKPKRP